MQDLKSATEKVFAVHQSGDLDVAEAMYDSILTQLPAPDFNILMGYGTLLIQRERYGIGVSLLQTAAKLYDRHAPTWTNLGTAYKYMGRDDLAVEAFDKAYALEPNAMEVLCGLGGYWVNRDEAKKVEDYSRRALAISSHPAAHMHLAIALLEQGRFGEAWPHYEHRWETMERKKHKRTYQSPKWDGSHVETLIIHGEQGLGDEIMFMSLMRAAQQRVGRVVVECADRLVGLFQDAFGVDCYKDEAELVKAVGHGDAHIAMASLPLILGLPNGSPFMPRPQTSGSTKPTIGLAWRGGTHKTNKDFRTLKLDAFKPIIESCNANFVAVQYGGQYVDDEAKASGVHTTPRDFDSLHYQIGLCDLVITVCQTAVHQAGAMGVPCWVLTPRKSAWRYKGADMMPWYESVRLFKQQGEEDWSRVIGQIADELRGRYAERAA